MFKRMMFGFSAVALSITVAGTAHAQAHFGVSAGVTAPLSDFGDVAKSGYNATALLSYSVPLAPIGVRAELGYNHFDRKSGGDSQIIDGAANIVLSMPSASLIKPYLTGGLGVYRHKASIPVPLGTFESMNTKLGFNGGAGISFGLSGFQTQLEARYVYITKENNAPAVQYVPVSFGILF
jgi:opacity protein-like surface antigen